MPLLNRLKEYRSSQGINQTELGKLAGVSRQTISLIERGDYSPSVTLALKIARIFQVSVEDIFMYEEDEDETGGTDVTDNDKMEEAALEADAPEERTIVRRISSKQRKLSLEEYRTTYLQVPKITDRKPVFLSGEIRDRLDEIVRRIGGRGLSVSGLVENLARQHLIAYGNDIDQWRKL